MKKTIPYLIPVFLVLLLLYFLMSGDNAEVNLAEYEKAPEQSLSDLYNTIRTDTLRNSGITDRRRMLARINELLKTDPDNKSLMSDKIHIAADIQPKEAIKECKALLEKDKDNYFALCHCALAHINLREFDTGIAYATKAAEIKDTAYVRNIIALAYHCQGKRKQAIFNYKKALELDPQNQRAKKGMEQLQIRTNANKKG